MSKKQKPQPALIWIDLETTGLEANLDVPLELGLAVTDAWGNLTHDPWKTLVFEYEEHAYELGERRGKANEYVNMMHQKNGLWEDLEAFKTLTREEADNAACDYLDECAVPVFMFPMAGNSIGSLDRPFVQRHFPQLNAHFHYRNLDVSSFKEACRLIAPELFAQQPPKAEGHRVLDDIMESIEEWKWYVDNFLFH